MSIRENDTVFLYIKIIFPLNDKDEYNFLLSNEAYSVLREYISCLFFFLLVLLF